MRLSPPAASPLPGMERDSAGPAAALPKSSTDGRGRPAAPGTRLRKRRVSISGSSRPHVLPRSCLRSASTRASRVALLLIVRGERLERRSELARSRAEARVLVSSRSTTPWEIDAVRQMVPLPARQWFRRVTRIPRGRAESSTRNRVQGPELISPSIGGGTGCAVVDQNRSIDDHRW